MNLAQSSAVLATVCLALAQLAEANVSAGANAAEFGELCTLVNLAEQQPDGIPAAAVATPAYRDLQRLNMSISDESWQKLFSKNGDGKNWLDDVPQTAPPGNNWAEYWNDWRTAMEETTEPKNMETINNAGYRGLDDKSKALLRSLLHPLAERAHRLNKRRQQLAKKIEPVTGDKIKTKLNEIVYGDASVGPKTATTAKALDGGTALAYSALCSTTKAAPKANTVAAALACICANDATAAESQVCGGTVKMSNTWTVANDIANSQLTDVLAFCPKHKLTADVADTLIAAIRNLNKAVRRQTAAAYLGTTEDGNCDGKNTGGICIKITDWGTDSTAALTVFKWARLATELAKDVTAAQEAAATIDTIDNAISETLAEALSLPKSGVVASILPTAAFTTHTNSPTDKQASDDCSKHHGKNATCPRGKCNYDEKEKKCNPIKQVEGSETTAAGAGEQTA
uniref:Variant surface glycoprotein 1125.1212 n=1 Tax=Trypanosoma brucei TaxID=5691 RepID=A0A1J0R6H0_9TRYP|nr:variant surface glycoprotein 1125.1212 [Trypanosoma brucei]